MSDHNLIKQQALEMLPQLTTEERNILDSLPLSFRIEAPYFKQTEKHFCGAACVQMLQAFYGDPVMDQLSIANIADWNNWKYFNHETFAEDFDRVMARLNFLTSRYYPGAFVLPRYETGAEGADFIVENRELFADLDFSFFKALLIKLKSPLLCRIHFVTVEYPMPEEMIKRLDNSGHCLLMVGYDEDGFIFHDPWDKSMWGGIRGGEYTNISYHFLKNIRPLVNCCKESIDPGTKLVSWFELPRKAVIQGRTIDLVLNVEWPGLPGILSRCAPAHSLSANLIIPEGISCLSAQIVQAQSQTFTPGSLHQFSWSIELGNYVGSYEIDAAVSCSLSIPARSWELHAKDETITIRSRATTRLDVKSTEWFNRYGRLDYA
jgi:hypothetical protein